MRDYRLMTFSTELEAIEENTRRGVVRCGAARVSGEWYCFKHRLRSGVDFELYLCQDGEWRRDGRVFWP